MVDEQSLPAFNRSLQCLCVLAVVVFVLRRAPPTGGWWLRSIGGWCFVSQWLVAAAIYIELAVLGWGVFANVFVCPPRMIHKFSTFAQRYAEDSARYSVMYSALWPYMHCNSGVLREYENIAIPPGTSASPASATIAARPEDLQAGRGEVTIASWSMARANWLTVPRGPAALNENYWPGWKACPPRRRRPRRTIARGAKCRRPGVAAGSGTPEDVQVEFYYLPDSFLWGSGATVPRRRPRVLACCFSTGGPPAEATGMPPPPGQRRRDAGP